MESDRPQGEVYHQEVHRDRSEHRCGRGGEEVSCGALGQCTAMATLLWILAVVLVIAGVYVLIARRDILWGVALDSTRGG